MHKIFKLIFFLVSLLLSYSLSASGNKAQWISNEKCQSIPNTWLSFRKAFDVDKLPQRAIARIAVDSKYWLYINNQLVVFEGGLKRGPNPRDTYYDEVDLAPYLLKGKNVIGVLVWHFGKNGFSHNNSGKAGLFFECNTPFFFLISDKTWKSTINPAFQTVSGAEPNYRLSESNILFDARKDLGKWWASDYDDNGWATSMELGCEGDAPWNQLIKRPIPQWKNYGLQPYTQTEKKGDTLICILPYNAQVTPYLKINARKGQSIQILTDNNFHFQDFEAILRAGYITKEGEQSFECFGWMNGHKVYYIIPEGIEILDVKYRETGYDTEFSGSFTCSDPFFNKLWGKAARTLYITMRDNYMDCPDRERAQWAGDAVNESGEAFYVLSKSSTLLTKKWLYEMIGWQKQDGTLFAPAPAGNWSIELPGQVLATIGYYGLWNYYMYSGDLETIRQLYPAAQRYLDLWELKDNGTAKVRQTAWIWGDWGDNIDKPLLFNGWYYLALKGMQHMATTLNKKEDAQKYEQQMKAFKEAYNQVYWKGNHYRSESFTEIADDRGQALAVVSGLADADKYPAILRILTESQYASPYMEKYVFEAMMQMGYESEAQARHKKRHKEMVENPFYSTLCEGWRLHDVLEQKGGTLNHAWTGGGLTILAQYVCGVSPLKPGFELFEIKPQPGDIKHAQLKIPSVKGEITTEYSIKDDRMIIKANVPQGTEAVITVPIEDVRKVELNKKEIWSKGIFIPHQSYTPFKGNDLKRFISVKVPKGNYRMEVIISKTIGEIKIANK